MKRYIVYIRKVLIHKWFVFLACIKLGVPLHIAVLHDISKFGKHEFNQYATHFYDVNGNRNDVKSTHGDFDPKEQSEKFRYALLHHQNNNKHHWNYWIVIGNKGSINPMPIPSVYLKEMVADWIGAGKAYTNKSNAKEWYEKEKGNMVLHERTKIEIEKLLEII